MDWTDRLTVCCDNYYKGKIAQLFCFERYVKYTIALNSRGDKNVQ